MSSELSLDCMRYFLQEKKKKAKLSTRIEAEVEAGPGITYIAFSQMKINLPCEGTVWGWEGPGSS